MGLATKQYTNMRGNLRYFLQACKSKNEKAMEEMFQLFGSRDRFIASQIVVNALSNFELKWKMKCLKLWHELEPYFDEPSEQAIADLAQQSNPQDQIMSPTVVDATGDSDNADLTKAEWYWRKTQDREEGLDSETDS
jgi:hypothetical protein